MLRIIMHGCRSKMGKAVCDMVQDTKDMEIVAGITREPSKYPFPVFETMAECDMPADVIIDFRNPSVVDDLVKFALDTKTPIIICTTGLSDATHAHIAEAAKHIPIMVSANMSLGINLLASLAKKIAPILTQEDFDIEILEKHHNQKLDSPSGTALLLANAMNDSLDNKFNYVYDRTKERKVRGNDEIGIHSIRGGTITGEHTIYFSGCDEVIELRHTAASKEVFAKGALAAAKFITTQQPGLYSMQDLLKID